MSLERLRDGNFFRWDGIPGQDWDIFLSQLHMRNGSEIDKFRLIPSHYRLRMEIFPIGMGSRRIPSLLGRDWDIFLSQKNIGMGLGRFFIPFAYTGSHPFPLPTLVFRQFLCYFVVLRVLSLLRSVILTFWGIHHIIVFLNTRTCVWNSYGERR